MADLFASGDIDFDEEPVGVQVRPIVEVFQTVEVAAPPTDLTECGCSCDYCRVGQHCLGIEGPCAHIEDRSDGQAALFSEGWSDAPREFPLVNEFIETEHECPKCHYKWSGSSR